MGKDQLTFVNRLYYLTKWILRSSWMGYTRPLFSSCRLFYWPVGIEPWTSGVKSNFLLPPNIWEDMRFNHSPDNFNLRYKDVHDWCLLQFHFRKYNEEKSYIKKKNLIFAVMLLSPQTPQSFCVFRFHLLILSNKSHLLLT